MRRKLMDVSAVRALGWAPRIDLEDGVRDTYAWYTQQAAQPVEAGA
jgi:GDP-L-fucose synthase